MVDPQLWNIERAAGLLLILTPFATGPGFAMFWQRRGHRGGEPRSHAHQVVERSSILSGVVLIAIGFILLESALRNTNGFVLANIGASAYFFGGVLLVAAEALMLTLGYDKVGGLVNIYVVMAFLAQAAIGGGVVLSGLLPAWIGWIAVVWNMAWLMVLALFARRDMYYPILHYLMPFVIGVALVVK